MSNLLKNGDVIVVDKSWKITAFNRAARLMTVGQTTKSIDNNGTEVPIYEGPSLDSWISDDSKKALKAARAGLKEGDEYLVVKTQMSGGGTGHGQHDVYPDGHEVQAIKLGKDHKYDPKGLRITFYQSGSFNCMIKQPKRIGTMKTRYDSFKPL